MIRVVRQDVREKTCLPTELVRQMAETEVIAHETWAAAR